MSVGGLAKVLKQLGMRVEVQRTAKDILWEVRDGGTKLGFRALAMLYLRCIADAVDRPSAKEGGRRGATKQLPAVPSEPRRLFCVVEFLLFARPQTHTGQPTASRMSSAASLHSGPSLADTVATADSTLHDATDGPPPLLLDYHGALALLRSRYAGWERVPPPLVLWLEEMERTDRRLHFAQFLSSELGLVLCPQQWRIMTYKTEVHRMEIDRSRQASSMRSGGRSTRDRTV